MTASRSVSGSPVSGGGRVLRVAAFQDITVQRQPRRLRTGEARTRSILDNMLGGLRRWTARRHRFGEPAAERIFGYPREG